MFWSIVTIIASVIYLSCIVYLEILLRKTGKKTKELNKMIEECNRLLKKENTRKMKPNDLFNYLKNIKHVEYNTAGSDVQYLVRTFDDEKRIRLIFEESCGKTDWKTNFNFPIKPYKKQENTLWYARGWAKAYKSCNDEIMKMLLQAHNENSDYEIEICGWSYGGALSLIAAEDFYYRTKIKCIVTTFGAPKPMFGRKTKQTVLNCCKEISQYANRNDCVPILPPFLGYCNGNKIKVGKKKLFGLFRPDIYHYDYGDKSLYKKV